MRLLSFRILGKYLVGHDRIPEALRPRKVKGGLGPEYLAPAYRAEKMTNVVSENAWPGSSKTGSTQAVPA